MARYIKLASWTILTAQHGVIVMEYCPVWNRRVVFLGGASHYWYCSANTYREFLALQFYRLKLFSGDIFIQHCSLSFWWWTSLSMSSWRAISMVILEYRWCQCMLLSNTSLELINFEKIMMTDSRNLLIGSLSYTLWHQIFIVPLTQQST